MILFADRFLDDELDFDDPDQAEIIHTMRPFLRGVSDRDLSYWVGVSMILRLSWRQYCQPLEN